MLVRYRGINNKGVMERPWTIWRVLDAISTTSKCQFTGKCWKVDFLTPCKTKSCQSSMECLRMLRALLPDTPRPHQFQRELWKNQTSWEPKGSHGRGPLGAQGIPWEGTLGSPRDPMGGDPWEPKRSHGRGHKEIKGAQGISWDEVFR